MELSGKILLTVALVDIYMLIQGMVIMAHTRAVEESFSQSAGPDVFQIRLTQSVTTLTVIAAVAVHLLLHSLLRVPNGYSFAYSLIVSNLSIIIIFNGQLRLKSIKRDSRIADPMYPVAILGIVVSVFAFIVGLWLSI